MRSRGPEVRVVARFKPLSEEENAQNKNKNISPMCVVYDQQNIEVLDRMHHAGAPPSQNFNKVAKQTGAINEMAKNFTIDEVFSDTTTQAEIYERVGRPIVKNVIKGYNGTILAYGQTGSGKTHSMMGPAGGGLDVFSEDSPNYKMRGIVPRMVEEIFRRLHDIPLTERTWTVAVSVFEIYREEIFDLLAPSSTNSGSPYVLDSNGMRERYRIREDLLNGNGIFIESLEKPEVQTAEEVIALIRYAANKRKTAVTNINETSSRSHSLVIIYLDQMDYTNDRNGQRIVSRLNLVDLAGSEKLHKTNAEGERLEEAKKINLSLTLLGNVIYKLTDGKSGYVPYRDSKLTRILQESLGGNSITTLLFHCSIAMYNREETLSTLRFAQRAKRVRNKPQINKDLSAKELSLQLIAAENKIISLENKLQVKSDIIARLRDSREAQDDELQSLIESLMHELEQLREELSLKEEELAHEKGRAELYQAELEKMTALREREKDQFATQLQLLEGTLCDSKEENRALRQQLEDLHNEWEMAAVTLTPRRLAKSPSPLPVSSIFSSKKDKETNTDVPYFGPSPHRKDETEGDSWSGAVDARRGGGGTVAATTQEDQVHRSSFMLGKPSIADKTEERNTMVTMGPFSVTEEGEEGEREWRAKWEERHSWVGADPHESHDVLEVEHPADESSPDGKSLHTEKMWMRDEERQQIEDEIARLEEAVRKKRLLLKRMEAPTVNGSEVTAIRAAYVLKGKECPACGYVHPYPEKKSQGTCTPMLSTWCRLLSPAPLLQTDGSPSEKQEEENALVTRWHFRRGEENDGCLSSPLLHRALTNEEICHILHTVSAFIQACFLGNTFSSVPSSYTREEFFAKWNDAEQRTRESHAGSSAPKALLLSATSSRFTLCRSPDANPEVLSAVSFLISFLQIIAQSVSDDPLLAYASPKASGVCEERNEKGEPIPWMRNDPLALVRSVILGAKEDDMVVGDASDSRPSHPSLHRTQELHRAQQALQDALCMAARVLRAWRRRDGELQLQDLIPTSGSLPTPVLPTPFSYPMDPLHQGEDTSLLLSPIFYVHEQLLSVLVLEDGQLRLLRRAAMQVQLWKEKRCLLAQESLRVASVPPLSYRLWCCTILPRKLWAVVSSFFSSLPFPPSPLDSSPTLLASTSPMNEERSMSSASSLLVYYAPSLWYFLRCAMDDVGRMLEAELCREDEESWDAVLGKYLSEKVCTMAQAHSRTLQDGIGQMTSKMKQRCDEYLHFSEKTENGDGTPHTGGVTASEEESAKERAPRPKMPSVDVLLHKLGQELEHLVATEVAAMYKTVVEEEESSMGGKRPSSSASPFLSSSGTATEAATIQNMDAMSPDFKEKTEAMCEYLNTVGATHINAILAQFPSFRRRPADESSAAREEGDAVEDKGEEEEKEAEALVTNLREMLLQTVREEIQAVCSRREEEVLQTLHTTNVYDAAWMVREEFQKREEEMKEAALGELHQLLAKMHVLAHYACPVPSVSSLLVLQKERPQHSPSYVHLHATNAVEKQENIQDEAVIHSHFLPAVGGASEVETSLSTSRIPLPDGVAPVLPSMDSRLTPSQLETLISQLRLARVPEAEEVLKMRTSVVSERKEEEEANAIRTTIKETLVSGSGMTSPNTRGKSPSILHASPSVSTSFYLPHEFSVSPQAGKISSPLWVLPSSCWESGRSYVEDALLQLPEKLLLVNAQEKAREATEEGEPRSLKSSSVPSPAPLPAVPTLAAMEWMAFPSLDLSFPLLQWCKEHKEEEEESVDGMKSEENEELFQTLLDIWKEEIQVLHSNVHQKVTAVMEGMGAEIREAEKQQATHNRCMIAISPSIFDKEEISCFAATLGGAASGEYWEVLVQESQTMPVSVALDHYMTKLLTLSLAEGQEMKKRREEVEAASLIAFAHQLQETALSSPFMQELHHELLKDVKEQMASIAQKYRAVWSDLQRHQSTAVNSGVEVEGMSVEILQKMQADMDQWCCTAQDYLLHSLVLVESQEIQSIARQIAHDVFSSTASSSTSRMGEIKGAEHEEGKTRYTVWHEVVQEELASLRLHLEEKIVEEWIKSSANESSVSSIPIGSERSCVPNANAEERLKVLGHHLNVLHAAEKEMDTHERSVEGTPTARKPCATSKEHTIIDSSPTSPMLAIIDRVIDAELQRIVDEANRVLSRNEEVIRLQEMLSCQHFLQLFHLTPALCALSGTTAMARAVVVELSESETIPEDREEDEGVEAKGLRDTNNRPWVEQEAKWLSWVEQLLQEADVHSSVPTGTDLSHLSVAQQRAIANAFSSLFYHVLPTLPLTNAHPQQAEGTTASPVSRGTTTTTTSQDRMLFPGHRLLYGFDTEDEKEGILPDGGERNEHMLQRLMETLLLPHHHEEIHHTQMQHLRVVLAEQLRKSIREHLPLSPPAPPSTCHRVEAQDDMDSERKDGLAEETDDIGTSEGREKAAGPPVGVEVHPLVIPLATIEVIVHELQEVCLQEVAHLCAEHAVENEKALKEVQEYLLVHVCRGMLMLPVAGEEACEEILSTDTGASLPHGLPSRTLVGDRKEANETRPKSVVFPPLHEGDVLPVSPALFSEVNRLCESVFTISSPASHASSPLMDGEGSAAASEQCNPMIRVTPATFSLLRDTLVMLAMTEQRHRWEAQQTILVHQVEMVVGRLRQAQLKANGSRMECLHDHTLLCMRPLVERILRSLTVIPLEDGAPVPIQGIHATALSVLLPTPVIPLPLQTTLRGMENVEASVHAQGTSTAPVSLRPFCASETTVLSMQERSMHIAQAYVQEQLAAEVAYYWKETILHSQPYVQLEEEIVLLHPEALQALAENVRLGSTERARSSQQVPSPDGTPSTTFLGMSSHAHPLENADMGSEDQSIPPTARLCSPPSTVALYSHLCAQMERVACRKVPEASAAMAPLGDHDGPHSTADHPPQKVSILSTRFPEVVTSLSQQLLALRAPELVMLTTRYALHTHAEVPTLASPVEHEVVTALRLLVAYLDGVSTALEEPYDDTSDGQQVVPTSVIIHPDMHPSRMEGILACIQHAIVDTTEEESANRQRDRQRNGSSAPGSVHRVSLSVEDAQVRALVYPIDASSPLAVSSAAYSSPDRPAVRATIALQDWVDRLQELCEVLEAAVVQEVQAGGDIHRRPSASQQRDSALWQLQSTPSSVSSLHRFLRHTPKEGNDEPPLGWSSCQGRPPVALLMDYVAAARRQKGEMGRGDDLHTMAMGDVRDTKGGGEAVPWVCFPLPAEPPGSPLFCLSPHLTHYHHMFAVEQKEKEAEEPKKAHDMVEKGETMHRRRSKNVAYVSMKSMLEGSRSTIMGNGEEDDTTRGNHASLPSSSVERTVLPTDSIFSEAQVLSDMNALQAVETVLRFHLARTHDGAVHSAMDKTLRDLASTSERPPHPSALWLEEETEEGMAAAWTVRWVLDRVAYRQHLEREQLEALAQNYRLDLSVYFHMWDSSPPAPTAGAAFRDEREATLSSTSTLPERKEEKKEKAKSLLRTLHALFLLQKHWQKHPFPPPQGPWMPPPSSSPGRSSLSSSSSLPTSRTAQTPFSLPWRIEENVLPLYVDALVRFFLTDAIPVQDALRVLGGAAWTAERLGQHAPSTALLLEPPPPLSSSSDDAIDGCATLLQRRVAMQCVADAVASVLHYLRRFILSAFLQERMGDHAVPSCHLLVPPLVHSHSRSPSFHTPILTSISTAGEEGRSTASSSASSAHKMDGGKAEKEMWRGSTPPPFSPSSFWVLLEARAQEMTTQRPPDAKWESRTRCLLPNDGVEEVAAAAAAHQQDITLHENGGEHHWRARDAHRVLWAAQNFSATLHAQRHAPPHAFPSLACASSSSSRFSVDSDLPRKPSVVYASVMELQRRQSDSSAPLPPVPHPYPPSLSWGLAPGEVECESIDVRLLSTALWYLAEERPQADGAGRSQKDDDDDDGHPRLSSSSPSTGAPPAEKGGTSSFSSKERKEKSTQSTPVRRKDTKGASTNALCVPLGAQSKEKAQEWGNEGGASCAMHGRREEDPVWRLLKRDDVRAALLALVTPHEQETEKDVKDGSPEPVEVVVLSSPSLSGDTPATSRCRSVMAALDVPPVRHEKEWFQAMRVLDERMTDIEQQWREEQKKRVEAEEARLECVHTHRHEKEVYDVSSSLSEHRLDAVEEARDEMTRVVSTASPNVVADHTSDVESIPPPLHSEELVLRMMEELDHRRREQQDATSVGVQTEAMKEENRRVGAEMRCLIATKDNLEQLLQSNVGVSVEELQEIKENVALAARDAEEAPTSMERQDGAVRDDRERRPSEEVEDTFDLLNAFLERLRRELVMLRKVKEPFWRRAVEDRDKVLAGIFDCMKELSQVVQHSTLETTQRKDVFEQRLRCLSRNGTDAKGMLSAVEQLRWEVREAEEKASEASDPLSSSPVVVPPLLSTPTASSDREKTTPTSNRNSTPRHHDMSDMSASRNVSHPALLSGHRHPDERAVLSARTERRHPPTPVVLFSLPTLQELTPCRAISPSSFPSPRSSFSPRMSDATPEKEFKEDPVTGEMTVVDPKRTSLPTPALSSSSGSKDVAHLPLMTVQKKAHKAPKEVVKALQGTTEWMNELQSLHYELIQRYIDSFMRAEKLEEFLEKSKHEHDNSKQELDAIKLILESKEKENQNMRGVLEEMNVDLEVYLSDLERQKHVNARLAKKAVQLQHQAATLATTAEQQEFCEMASLELTIRSEEILETETALENVLTFYDPELIAKKRQHIGKTIRSIGTFCQKIISMCQSRPRFNTGTLESQRLNILQETAELYNRFEWAKEELNEQIERQKSGLSR